MVSRTGLVKILGTDNSHKPTCTGAKSCLNEYFRVRHYNLNTRGFEGQIETFRIPQMPAKQSGLLPSSIRDLECSPAGSQGWYLYGDRDLAGVFTVAALQPRSLFTLTPQREIVDTDAKFDYLDRPLRFRELQSLGAELENTLAPLGIVRQDWQQNATKLTGTQVAKGFASSNNPIAGLVSWR